MEFVRGHGYPAPEVFDVSDDGLDLVMERVDGPTMVEMGASKPWRLSRLGAQLADLHQSLHGIVAPEWLHPARIGGGHQVVHMDLHPLNVLMSRNGPIVIDWTNTAAGDPSVDVVATWILVASGEVPSGRVMRLLARFGRRVLLRSFLAPFDERDLRSVLADVVEWKCRDRNMSPVEVARMRAMVRAGDR